MLGYLVITVIASVFYYIGNHEYYEKGWLLAVVSGLLSYGAISLLPFGFLGAFGVNILFYLALLV